MWLTFQLCVQKLRILIEDSDQNCKYIVEESRTYLKFYLIFPESCTKFYLKLNTQTIF